MRLMILPFCLALALTPAAFAQTPPPQITVTGDASVEAAPDVATISLGVTSDGKTAAEALATNSDALAQVLENLRAAGVEDRDLQTSGLSLNPNFDYSSSGNAAQIRGYIAANQLTVRVRDLASLGAILDAAVRDGANTLNGVAFGIALPEPLLDEARKGAVAAAFARAKLLADAAGVTLGPILSISENAGYSPGPKAFAREASIQSEVPVATGEVSLSASVTIVWQLGN